MNRAVVIHRIVGTLTTRAPLHVGSGGIAPSPPRLGRTMTDDPGETEDCEVAGIVRDHVGLPCIPGTSLKGVLRQWAEAWLTTQPAHDRLAGRDRIDRLFGAQSDSLADGNAGMAEFCTATFRSLGTFDYARNVPWWDAARKTGIATHVGIDRDTGAALPGILFFEEFVPEGVSFDVTIDIPRATTDDVAFLLGILEDGVADPVAPIGFGAGGSNGWGLMHWSGGRVMQRTPGSGFEPVAITAAAVSRTPPKELLVATLSLVGFGPFVVNDASRTHLGTVDSAPIHVVPLRRADGGVWLPAASFRGCLRSHYENLLRTLAQSGSLTIAGETVGLSDPGLCDQSVERVFGSSRTKSAIGIHEFRESPAPNSAPTVERVSVAIDRFTGGAADGMLVTVRAVDRPRFETRITIDGDRLESLDRWLLGRVFADVARGVVSFGALGSRGFGEMSGSFIMAPGERWLDMPRLEEGSSIPPLPSPTVAAPLTNAASKPAAATRPIERGQLLRGGRDGSSWTLQTEKLNKMGQPVRHAGVSPRIASPQVMASKDPAIPVEFQPGSDGKPTWIRCIEETWTPAAKNAPGAAPSRDGRFIHPYYFLPLTDREKREYPPALADAPPSSHARLEAEKVSGTIRLRLTTQTPLVLCESKSQSHKGEHHPIFAVPTEKGPTGDAVPVLLPSQVRGMLRAAFEAITNSRFGVFASHDRRLGMRMQVQEGLDLVPCRVEGDSVRLLPGDQNAQGPAAIQRAAWIARDLLQHHPRLAHQAEVQAWVQLFEKRGPRGFRYWKVISLDVATSTTMKQPQASGGHGNHKPVPGASLRYIAKGYLCVNGYNYDGKHDERVFFHGFADDSLSPLPPHMSVGVKERWQELIFDYRQNEDLLRGLKRPSALRSAFWSRHMQHPPRALNEKPDDMPFDDGMLAYAKLDGNGVVTDIYPVMISRKLHKDTPRGRLPASLSPAEERDQLSPADRVFGWVSQKKREANGPAKVRAHRSQLRVRRVTCQTQDAIDTNPITLAILGQPKPSLGRFYLGDPDGTVQKKRGSKEATGYDVPRRIRGPKIYPHHAAGIVRKEATTTERSKQNRTVLGTVKPGVAFECDIDVCNLSTVEIGAILWLLSLPEHHFLRIGYGKPLGFGSVRAEVVTAETRLATGADWAQAIASNTLPKGNATAWQWKALFESAAGVANPILLGSFSAAAKGFPGYPVHYPRLETQAPGASEHFEWFKANDAPGNQHPLPDLHPNDPSLPILSARRR